MRPLLEALFHRILLLPPLEQRLDSLIYIQEASEPHTQHITLLTFFILFSDSKESFVGIDLNVKSTLSIWYIIFAFTKS